MEGALLMGTGQKYSGSGQRHSGSDQRQKKQTPAQRTFAYEYYLLKQMREKTPMVLKLVNGETLTGTITWYDQYAIKLEPEEGPNMVVQKQAILYYYKADGSVEPNED
jgi:RNA chaperone Hfq